MDNRQAIGIDLGTTNSAVAYVDAMGAVRLVKNNENSVISPSAIYFDGSATLFGRPAFDAFGYAPQNVAMFFKRDMGNQNFAPEYASKEYSAEDLSSLFLGHLRELTEREIGPPGPLIVTVPAYFHNAERESTMNAARRAGFDVLRTINEPTAAAVAYGANHPELEGLVMVYDLGGGTFDVTLLEYTKTQARVIASDGDNQLGGVLWDDRLMNYVADLFQAEQGVDPRDDSIAAGELRIRCEEAKRFLSSKTELRVAVNADGKRGHVPVTRAVFEDISSDLLDRTRILMLRLLSAADIRWPEIDAVLLVGGSTRMPAVKTLLTQLSRKEPLGDINPDECVAIGAALQAKADTQPSRGSAPATTPMHFLPGQRSTVDVTPHSLGYVAISPDGAQFVNDIIINKNKPIPFTSAQKSVLPTVQHRPNRLDIYLLQGESRRVLDNTVLGLYVVENVPHTKGEATLEIGFRYDESGIVNVRCRETKLGLDLAVSVSSEPLDLSWTDLDPREYRKRFAISVMLVIDTSSSMSGSGIAEAIKGANSFLDNLDAADASVGVAAFGGGGGRLVHDTTTNLANIRRSVGGLSASGGTPMASGLSVAENALASGKDGRFVVVLTDGSPDSQPDALAVADRMKKDGIRIIAIGAGSANHAFLRQLASDPDASIATSFADLSNTFGRIARSLGGSSGLQRFVK